MQWKNSPGGPIFDYIRVYAKITPGGPIPARFNPFIDMDKVWIGFSSAKARFFLLLDWGEVDVEMRDLLDEGEELLELVIRL